MVARKRIMIKYLEMAFEEALKSDSTSHRHGAIIVKGTNILSKGYNQKKTHPALMRYCDEQLASLHAETHALFRTSCNVIGADLYVVRRKRGDKFGLSKPCEICMKILKNMGIRKAIYSNSDGTFSVLRI